MSLPTYATCRLRAQHGPVLYAHSQATWTMLRQSEEGRIQYTRVVSVPRRPSLAVWAYMAKTAIWYSVKDIKFLSTVEDTRPSTTTCLKNSARNEKMGFLICKLKVKKQKYLQQKLFIKHVLICTMSFSTWQSVLLEFSHHGTHLPWKMSKSPSLGHT